MALGAVGCCRSTSAADVAPSFAAQVTSGRHSRTGAADCGTVAASSLEVAVDYTEAHLNGRRMVPVAGTVQTFAAAHCGVCTD